MEVSASTIEAITYIITGDTQKSPYKTKQQLINFFSDFPTNNQYEHGLLGRFAYAMNELRTLNGTAALKKVIEEVTDPAHYNVSIPAITAVTYLNKYLIKDGYKLERSSAINSSSNWMIDDEAPYLIKKTATENFVETNEMTKLSHEFIYEQIKKSKEKIANNDYDGAITNARSLIEAIQEEIILKCGKEIPDYKGDLDKLYKITKQLLNLDPAQKDLSDTLKQILTGLNSINSGVAGLSNKMADRHSRTYKPQKHHAKVAVNAAFTFCEFLLDTFEYQRVKIIGTTA